MAYSFSQKKYLGNLLFLFALGFDASGCDFDFLPFDYSESSSSETDEDFESELPPREIEALDVLFVLDASGSMIDELETISSSTELIFSTLRQTTSNIHAAIIVPELLDPSSSLLNADTPQYPNFIRTPAAQAEYIEAGCQNTQATNQQWFSFAEDECRATQDFAASVASLSELAASGYEQPWQAVIQALEKSFLDENGFRRAEADLMIVIVSDEDDCSLIDPIPESDMVFFEQDPGFSICYGNQRSHLVSPSSITSSLITHMGDYDAHRLHVAMVIGGYNNHDGTFVPGACAAQPSGADPYCHCWSNCRSRDELTDVPNDPSASIQYCPEYRYLNYCELTARNHSDIDGEAKALSCEALGGNRHMTILENLVGWSLGSNQVLSICDPLGRQQLQSLMTLPVSGLETQD